MIVLITGGIKSGKSDFALSYAEKKFNKKSLYFLATASALDKEMELRIKKHKESRSDIWKTIEENYDLVKILSELPDSCTVLIDCVTLWLLNLLCNDSELVNTPENISSNMHEILEVIKSKKINALFITNEIGSGIIPDNKLSRIYGDILGKTNQQIASCADTVYLMVSGINIKIK